MKKLILIQLIFVNCLCFGQGGGAYKQLQAPNNNLSQTMQYWGAVSAQNNNRNKAYNEYVKRNNYNAFYKAKNNAIKAYNSRFYTTCISYYQQVKKLGYQDSEFELLMGYCYYHLSEETSLEKFKRKYRKKAKKFFKKSKRHGNIDAEQFLEKYY